MSSRDKKKAAIYHFTDKSEKRPVVYRKELQRLRKFTESCGFDDYDEYVDMSLRKKDQTKKRELLSDIDDYSCLVLRDFYHLCKNTGACMEELVRLSKSGITVKTIEDGNFTFTEAPFSLPLRVVVYYCGLEIVGHSVELQMAVMRMFIKEKTNWTLIDSYADISGNRKDGSQVEILKLMQNQDNYDVILVQSFNDIHWRTAMFCKNRHKLKKDIYSMHEEVFLPYGKEIQHE